MKIEAKQRLQAADDRFAKGPSGPPKTLDEVKKACYALAKALMKCRLNGSDEDFDKYQDMLKKFGAGTEVNRAIEKAVYAIDNPKQLRPIDTYVFTGWLHPYES